MGGTLVVSPLPGIGDMIWHLPHIRAISAATPEGQVSILTKRRTKADRLLAAHPDIRKILWLDRSPGVHGGFAGLLKLAELLRQQRFLAVWILHQSARYGCAAWMAGIPVRYGFGSIRQRVFLNRPTPPFLGPEKPHPIERADQLLRLNGVALWRDEPVLHVSPEALGRIEARYGDLPRPWIAVGIGTSDPKRQWGWKNYANLICAANTPERRTLFLMGGGPAEAEAARSISENVRQSGARVENAVGLEIEDAMALLAMSDLYVGNNTGFLNVAAALGVSALGLFGGSTPLTYSPCIHCITPAKSDGTMADISVAQVLEEMARHGLG